MATASIFFLIFLSFSLSRKTLTFVNANTDTIQNTCKATKYYDLCVSTLESDPTSSTTDTKGLAAIMVNAAASNATATASFLTVQLLGSTNDTVLKKVLKECADKYTYASDALQETLQDLSAEAYDYAYMRVMAAEEYQTSCRNAFRRYRGLVYPAELGKREQGLKRICDVVLGIVNHLVS